MKPMFQLDNPAWHSLNEVHQPYALGNEQFKRYAPDVAPFSGINGDTGIPDLLSRYISVGESLYIIGARPPLPPDILIEKELICLQMVCPDMIPPEAPEPITFLTDVHNSALTELINLVQPGYFREKTKMLGDYFGIFKENKLVAVTGERMRMNSFTEISAVVTHPDFTGRGYARQLVAHAVNKNLSDNNIPYLHVAADNLPAIRLYEKLGFETRRKMSFWKIIRR